LQEEPYTAGLPREAPRSTVRPLDTERDVSGERLLVRAARDGDQDAIGALFDLHYTSVFRFLFVKTGRQEDAEDLAQEVFLRMIGALERYEERGLPFRAF